MSQCRECGNDYTPRTGRGRPNTVFCASACGKRHANRRMSRGIILYDLMMQNRYNRKETDPMKMRGIMARVTQSYRDEDIAERDGRQSWDDLADIMEKVCHLRYVARVWDGTGRKRA